VAQALHGPVVEVHLAHVEAASARQGVADDLNLMVLRGHLDEARVEVADGVVRPVVSKTKTPRLGAGRSTDDLVAETDPEQRPPIPDRRLREGNGTCEPRRVARSG